MARALILFLLLQLPGMARAQLPVPPSEVVRIQEVIASQVMAFREGDLEEAFSFAAPGIQATFGNPQTFGVIVERGYGQIFSTLDFNFEDTLGNELQPIQAVRFTGTDLTAVMAFYFMELQPDREWRIAGVSLQPLADQAI